MGCLIFEDERGDEGGENGVDECCCLESASFCNLFLYLTSFRNSFFLFFVVGKYFRGPLGGVFKILSK